MNDEDRKSETIDVDIYDGKPAFVKTGDVDGVQDDLQPAYEPEEDTVEQHEANAEAEANGEVLPADISAGQPVGGQELVGKEVTDA